MSNNKLYIQLLSLIGLILHCITGYSHEFWLQPLNFQLQERSLIEANLRVGQHFKGEPLRYFKTNFETFELTMANKTVEIESRFGQLPALSQLPLGEGLHIASYISNNSTVVYPSPEKFTGFLTESGLDWVLTEHQQRGLPASGFTEAYKRYVKSLIAVGNGDGQDQILGLDFEWVVNDNPYQLSAKQDNISLQLLWQGKPFTNKKALIFNRIGDKVLEAQLITDDQGKIVIPVLQGGEFMVSAVHMVRPSPELSASTEAVWQSLWTSTSFAVDKSK
ncbi:DUF4198 domain-containing protein [Oceanicoccus sp. KOV_DT_Chl]|uniref:DUF4198 domain-containing protein n=1 Tax=Oceanicoccus sp. KOV_DT_Chl TaxID=1904639 RepID=UPI000C7C1CA2|nr:DUF4198 domain-containing protein [Oceanicoccus sp. KOV_DT_Chl]